MIEHIMREKEQIDIGSPNMRLQNITFAYTDWLDTPHSYVIYWDNCESERERAMQVKRVLQFLEISNTRVLTLKFGEDKKIVKMWTYFNKYNRCKFEEISYDEFEKRMKSYTAIPIDMVLFENRFKMIIPTKLIRYIDGDELTHEELAGYLVFRQMMAIDKFMTIEKKTDGYELDIYNLNKDSFELVDSDDIEIIKERIKEI